MVSKVVSADEKQKMPNYKEFKIARPLLIIKDGEVNVAEKAFINCLTLEKGEKVVKDLDFVPVNLNKKQL